jgi:hypothetical protein
VLASRSVQDSYTYLVAVLTDAGLAAAGFLSSGAATLGLADALGLAVGMPPGRSEARLVVFGGTALAGSFAAVGFASAFTLLSLAAGFAAVGAVVVGFAAAGFVLMASGLGFDAGAAAVVFGVVGGLGIDLATGLLLAAALDAEGLVVEMFEGFLISCLAFVDGVPFVFALSSVFGASVTAGAGALDASSGSVGAG